MNKASPLLYVHVPFCVHKCGYCDFNSWAETRRAPQETWAAALKAQVQYWGHKLRSSNLEFSSVFFGGGTPSLLENDLFSEVLRTIQKEFKFSKGAEWNIEVNPETLTAERLSLWTDLGITRLSMGLQSFHDKYLERLERKARKSDNLRALELLKKQWSGQWSGDLMFALPQQSLQEWQEDLKLLLTFEPKHVSSYQLTLTTERSKNWKQGQEDELLDFFNLTEEILGAHGLQRYEISNFSQPGFECRHNLGYWQLHPFLGVGPGASGLLNSQFLDALGPYGMHQKNPDRFETWSTEIAQEKNESLNWLKPRTAKDHLFELLMMSLRTREGLHLSRLGSFGEAGRAEALGQMAEFIEPNGETLRMTPQGLRILDSLLPKLFEIYEKKMLPYLDSGSFDPKF